MDIGLGLPSTIPGVDPATVLTWAADAEARGFASVGVVDRLVYPNLDPMTMLAAAAVVTTGVRLVTGVLVSPIRSNFPAFAKQAATIDRLSGGRLVLGLGVGNRADDFTVAGLDYHRRGRSFDAQLAEITAIWRGERPELGPEPARVGGPELLFGGTSSQAYRRMTQYGAGWFASTSTGAGFSAGRDVAVAAWEAAGRSGRPRLVAHSYAGLGPGALESARSYLGSYYAHRIAEIDDILGAALLDADRIRERVELLREAGCDEFILTPVDADPEQVQLLADASGI
jgi:alkanesulfonate monooxygenase SsuD/methylene tetrahydromethanopterin reductase-like flavin-dependent oxidoreductase (luciferase family)